MEKFIKHSGFANANSARVQWSGVKKKVLSMAGEDGFVAPANASTPTPRKRKPKATATDEGGTEENGSPTKKARTPKKKAVAKEKGSDEDKDTKKDEKKHEADGEDTSMKKVEEN